MFISYELMFTAYELVFITYELMFTSYEHRIYRHRKLITTLQKLFFITVEDIAAGNKRNNNQSLGFITWR
jgi:hypothetical protein